MEALRLVVLILAIGGLVKGVWMILWPEGAMKMMGWWLDLPERALQAAGGFLVLAGLALIGLAVTHMNAVVAVVTVFGTISVLTGILYQWPGTLRSVTKPWRGDRGRYGMRLFGILVTIIAGALFFVYMRPR